MPSNSYYLGSNNSSAMLQFKPPVRVRADLTPEFLRHRIPEILGQETYSSFCQDFYHSLYHHFFSNVGYPIKDVFPVGTNHNELKLGDVITIEEVANYSRLYQRAPNDNGFLIVEQILDTSNPEINVWKTLIKKQPSKMEVYYKDCSAEGVLTLSDLQKEDFHLYHNFKEFIDGHKLIFVNCLLDKLPKEKAQIIRESNPDTPGMIYAIWEDFLQTVL